jgi:Na+-translocating ferredoxin:NAD+ oxidoreductase RnfG subunit
MKKIVEYMIPGVKLFVICAVAATILGLINEVTEPVIIETQKKEQEQALKSMFTQDNWQKIPAVPFSFAGKDFEDNLLKKCKTKEQKQFLAYSYDFDGNTNTYRLKRDLSLDDREKLGAIFKDIGYRNMGPVDSYFPVTQNQAVMGYALKITGSGYGGDMTIIAGYNTDGSIRNVKLLDNNETPGLGKKAELEGYMDKFIGTGGDKPVPVIKNMLKNPKDIDAVTGASITFMGLADALRAGSDFVKKIEGK